MKRIFTFFCTIVLAVGLQAQNVDYEIVGFLDADDDVIEQYLMTSNEDLQPRVLLKNNGPGVCNASDSIIFDIYNNDELTTYIYIHGSELQSMSAGETRIISLPSPIYTSEVMDQFVMTSFVLCYEVRIVGTSVDSEASNNSACLQISRPLPVIEYAESAIRLYPNPAAHVLNISCPGFARLQIVNMLGQVVYIQEASGDAQIDVSDLEKGVYFVRVVGAHGSSTHKFIKS